MVWWECKADDGLMKWIHIEGMTYRLSVADEAPFLAVAIESM
jgi:hypothetical protein